MNAFGQSSSLRTCTARQAVEAFLKAMKSTAAATFPGWRQILTDGLAECDLDHDTRRAVLDQHPLDDYYFAAVVGMEAAKIRMLFGPEDATELLAQVAEQVDRAAGRPDRLVSDLVFDVISEIELVASHPHKLPHDHAIKVLLHRMRIDSTGPTRCLMGDVLFRHQLGEPLARSVPQWWMPFRSRFAIAKVQPAPHLPPITLTPKPARRLI
jgi:hypothetical protein